MTTYQLTAQKGTERHEHEFEAEDSFDATTTAISYVLDQAMESEAWAKGRIELRCGEKVLHVMKEKG